jgi:hypothetical protein
VSPKPNFPGRQLVEADTGLADYDPSKDDVVKQIMESDSSSKSAMVTDGGGLVNPTLKVPRPTMVSTTTPKAGLSMTPGPKPAPPLSSKSRLQDPQLQEMSDSGVCLTMHQPYASLLVMGIKVDEGRNWYSAHRGRMWIHAASKVPSDEEVRQVEDFYKMRNRAPPPFPASYPTSCLLGSVDVADCLSQEDYRDKNPDGESASPYVFVCRNHQELLIKFPMSGQHKICEWATNSANYSVYDQLQQRRFLPDKLDPQIHQAAKKSVKKTAKTL